MSARKPDPNGFRNEGALAQAGLTHTMLAEGLLHTYRILDTIDAGLVAESLTLSEVVEGANYSSIIGNVFGAGIAIASGGLFTRSGPHKYQDLRHKEDPRKHVEIKVALESNKPKGHLAKEGYYLICRYILSDAGRRYTKGSRGKVAWIYELRFGHLSAEHFSISNTEGDSGKTANINAEGMVQLKIVYYDREALPYKKGTALAQYT